MTRDTINRGWLKRQVAKGNVIARCKYHYTDDYLYDAQSNYGETGWLNARLNPKPVYELVDPNNPYGPNRLVNRDQIDKPGHISFDDHDFTSQSGHAWWNPGGESITFLIHSNLSFELKLVAKPGSTEEKALTLPGTRKATETPDDKALKDKLERLAQRITAEGIERLRRQGINYPGCEKSVTACVVYGKKYAKIDVGESGRYMVEVSTGKIYGIKGYGVIHRGHYYGTLDEIDGWGWGDYRAYKLRQPAPTPAAPRPLNRFEGYLED